MYCCCLQPVNRGSLGRIAPVSASLASARRDPRLARSNASAAPASGPPPPAPAPPAAGAPSAPIASNVFDIKPLAKRKNVISFDVQPASQARRRDPRLDKREARPERPRRDKGRPKAIGAAPAALVAPVDRKKPDDRERKRPEIRKNDEARKERLERERKAVEEDAAAKEKTDSYIDKLMIADPKKINKLPPIPKKVNRDEPKDEDSPSPVKKRKEVGRVEKKRRENSVSSKDSSSGSSPDKKLKGADKETARKPKPKERRAEPEEEPAEPEMVAFKELKNYHKERYMRRNKEKSASPDAPLSVAGAEESQSKISLSVTDLAAVILVVSDAESTCCVQIKYFSTAGVFILTCFATIFVPLLLRITSVQFVNCDQNWEVNVTNVCRIRTF